MYSFTLFGIVIQCNLKWTARVDQTILAVIYNQSRMTNKSRYSILKFAATVTKAVIDLYEPVSDSILKLDLVSWYK